MPIAVTHLIILVKARVSQVLIKALAKVLMEFMTQVRMLGNLILLILTQQAKLKRALIGNPKPKKIVSAAPVETWKSSIPRNNYIVPAESTFLYPTMTQRLLYMPHYSYYNSENLSNHKEDNSEYETLALFLVSVVVIGLFMFCAWLFLFN